ncbi:MAG: thermonuclease family protein [Candidatus Bilamarchaeaceae archaeon]
MIRRAIAISIASLLALMSQSDEHPRNRRFLEIPEKNREYEVVVLRVIDGDTLDVGLIVPVRVRLDGVDAPEVKTEKGANAKKFVEKVLEGAKVGDVRMVMVGKDKYGRVLGTVEVRGKDLGEMLIEEGMASKPISWWP